MYESHLTIKPSKNGMGHGIFASIKIPAGVPIFEATGNVYTEQSLPKEKQEIALQIGPDLFIGSSGGTMDYINHSCNPNCLIHIVGTRAILYSLYVIAPDTELTFDYSANSTDSLEQWNMNCLCSAPNCRKVISGFHLLDSATQEDLKKKGAVPMFITNPIFIRK